MLVAVLAACTINLRMLLYSASISPYLADEPLPRRFGAAYLLTDQAYAVSIARWSAEADDRARFPYFLGAGLLLWFSWQLSTIVGALVGSAVPADVPLDFAVPLVFLVLLVPTLTSRPARGRRHGGGWRRGRRGGGRRRAAVRHRRSAVGHRRGCGRRGARGPETTLSRVWAVIVLAGAGTFAMRASFLVAANRVANVPAGIQRLLRQIPPAALASLVLPALVRPHDAFDLAQGRLVAGVLAALGGVAHPQRRADPGGGPRRADRHPGALSRAHDGANSERARSAPALRARRG